MVKKYTKFLFLTLSMGFLILNFQNCARSLDQPQGSSDEASQDNIDPLKEATLTPIVTLYSTGLDKNRKPLSPGSRDSHYFMGNNQQLAYVSEQNSAWVDNSSESVWISPAADTLMDSGDYSVKTTFDLSAWHHETANISLRLSVDDHLVDVLLNNISVAGGLIMPSEGHSYENFTNTISIQYGFVDGVNTLEFIFNNIQNNSATNPTGIRVELSGNAEIK